MHIAKDNDQCSICNTALETLAHILLYCHHTEALTDRPNVFIKSKVDRNSKDRKKYNFITCYHTNSLINYINMAVKWYKGNNFQNSEALIWDEYVRYVKLALTYERQNN